MRRGSETAGHRDRQRHSRLDFCSAAPEDRQDSIQADSETGRGRQDSERVRETQTGKTSREAKTGLCLLRLSTHKNKDPCRVETLDRQDSTTV